MAAVAVALRNKRQQPKLSLKDLPELPNGKNAWNKDKETKKPVRRKLQNRNKVSDYTFTNNDAKTPTYKQSGVVNVVLYVGFIMIGFGLILTFIGMGERGFKTKELQLIGPSLIGCGILFALLRILFCSCTCNKNKSKPIDEKSLLSPSSETLVGTSQSNQMIQPLPAEGSQESVGMVTKTMSARRPATTHSVMPNYVEDEVESDVDLGLIVKEEEEAKGWNPVKEAEELPKKSRPSTSRSLISQRSKLPEIIHVNSTNNEVILDPSKLNSPF